ncbi:MAG: hypothetical protein NC548_34065 [Lachnospiraceae bacterium]|nr:hypothetical protein [Lachnospiraceae bacterium]
MERLKAMKETLISCVQTQLGNLANVDTHELGEAVDMVKDLCEAIMYCEKVKCLEESKKEHEELKKELEKMRTERPQEYHHYYTEKLMPYYMPDPYPYYMDERDMDRGMGRMYYSERQPRNS